MTRLAVLVGIDHYEGAPLEGCVKDVERMERVLGSHADDSLNFECRSFKSSPAGPSITRDFLREKFQQLFVRESDVVLFYFAGHGKLDPYRGAIMVTQDRTQYDPGVPLNDLLAPLARSPAKQKIVIVDCCYGGAMGEVSFLGDGSILTSNLAVLTASRRDQAAQGNADGGLFTTLLIEALEGAAANALGDVNIVDAYAYASTIFTGWQQRPLFKANISSLISLRKCEALVPDEVAKHLVTLFPRPDFELGLDPGYEPTDPSYDPRKGKIFSALQRLRDARLLVPSGGATALYFAAVNSQSCKLTPLGQGYWKAAKNKWVNPKV
jgi:hypothetical protein